MNNMIKLGDSITLYNEDCNTILDNMIKTNSYIDLCITSPPYYNVREYSQYEDFESYLIEMERIFSKLYKVLNNHRYLVLNVGDISCLQNKSKWSMRKFPLGAYFIVMLEKIGFQFIDDYIWDKGEPQSKRHLGNPPYPFYQYPVNCYEHILIFAKHKLDKTKIPCPICNETIIVSNSQSSVGVQSWECKNPNCTEKSKNGRGKRFSARSIMMNNYKVKENEIPKEFISKFRRDIVKINPVIKINSKGENIKGHTAPFPKELPEFAIRYFSGTDDTVMDCFMGSGTTGVMCKYLNRKFIGIELNKDYFNLCVDRIKESKDEVLF